MPKVSNSILYPLSGAPDYYFNRKGEVYTNRVSTRHRKGGMREVKQSTSAAGYKYVRVMYSQGCKAVYIHRLLADKFSPPPSPGQTLVRHLNGNPSDNSLKNLAWGSQADNMADCVKHGRTLKGKKNPSAKLNDNLVRAIRLLVKEGYSARAIGTFLGVGTESVRLAATGQQWGHVNDI